jgi:hypothetical protein
MYLVDVVGVGVVCVAVGYVVGVGVVCVAVGYVVESLTFYCFIGDLHRACWTTHNKIHACFYHSTRWYRCNCG